MECPKEDGIEVQVAREFEAIDFEPGRLGALIRGVCVRFGVLRGTMSIGIVSDAEFRVLNARYLGRKGSSDCLSFDLSEDGDTAGRLFELVVNGEVASLEAQRRGHSAEAELALYVAHGLLHHLGHEDSTEDGATRMHAAEDEILEEFGYGRVYDSGGGRASAAGSRDKSDGKGVGT